MGRRWPVKSGRRRLILLVESEPGIANVLRRALAGKRRVVVASGVGDALIALDPATRFDALVTSYRLRDGTALRLLRLAMKRCPDVLRVLYIEQESLRPMLAAAANRVVLTTATFDELRAAVEP